MLARDLVAIALLVAINGFFVAAEFALVSTRPERLTDANTLGKRLVRRQIGALDEYLSACQLGITMASLALGALGEPAIAGLLEPVFESTALAHIAATLATICALLIMTALHITAGEQAPKSFAIGSAERVAAICAIPLEAFARLLRPLVRVLNAASNGLVRLAGGTPTTTHASQASLQELRHVIAAATASGDIARMDARLLSGVFTLDELTATDVMTPRHRVAAIHENTTVKEAVRLAAETRHSRLPVLDSEDEGLLGLVLVRTLSAALLEDRGDEPAAAFRRDMLVTPPTQHLDRLLTRMQTARASLCAVIDEYGQLDGVVSVEDIIEQVVGEIEDEDDRPNGIRRLRSGALVAPGDTPLVDLRAYGVELEDDGTVESVGGLIQRELDRIPEERDTVEVGRVRLRVLSLERHRVKRVLVEQIEQPPAPAEEPS